MKFDYPFVLAAFAIFIPIVLFDIFGSTRKYRQMLPKNIEKKLISSSLFFRLFLAFSIIALAGPRWGTGFSSWEYRRGLDIVFAIDVSRSMDIRDVQTSRALMSRLDRGISIAEETAAAVSGARFAAAIGRGRGFLAVPLTWDNEAALRFLESLDGSAMTGRSTNLESLLDAAADAFVSSSPAQKVIVLFSDGETHAGILRNALNRCAKEGIVVDAIALGSDEGRPVPPQSSAAQTSEYFSKRDASVMRMTAERTGGIYIDGGRDDVSSALSSHLLSIAQYPGQGDSRNESRERRTLFIILAIISYAAGKLFPLLPRLSLFSALSVLFIFTSCSEGKLLLLEANYLSSRGRYDEAIVPYLKAQKYKDAEAYAEYGIGLTFYSIDEGKPALKRFSESQRLLESYSPGEHRELRFRNSYNSGIIYFEEGDFQAAAAAFRDALRSDPRKIEAKRNLELSLMSIVNETSNNNGADTGQETREILFEFIKQQEQQRWKSMEWAPEENFTGPDY